MAKIRYIIAFKEGTDELKIYKNHCPRECHELEECDSLELAVHALDYWRHKMESEE